MDIGAEGLAFNEVKLVGAVWFEDAKATLEDGPQSQAKGPVDGWPVDIDPLMTSKKGGCHCEPELGGGIWKTREDVNAGQRRL